MARELALLGVLVACRASADPGPAFRVDVAPPATCRAGATCEARVKLTALGDYKVNEEYPFKFVADASEAVVVDGTGKFARETAKTGTLVIRLRAQRAGTAQVSGKFKLSVCTQDICKIEAPQVRFAVPVT